VLYKLERILNLAILENCGLSGEYDWGEAYNEAVNIILEQTNLFDHVPQKVLAPSSLFKNKIRLPLSGVAEYEMIFFPKKAVMLFDGIEAAALSRHSYIYRSKGARVYLFENGYTALLTPHGQIDHEGLFISNESWFDDISPDSNVWKMSGFSLNSDEVQSYFYSVLGDANKKEMIPCCLEIIKMLCNIKMPFHKDYSIEYLLTPPDVNINSTFSNRIMQEFWCICLSEDYLEKYGKEQQGVAMQVLTKAGIPPDAKVLIDYLSRVGFKDNDNIMLRLKQLEDNLVKKIELSNISLRDEEFWVNLINRVSSKHTNLREINNIEDLKQVIHKLIIDFKIMVENNGIWKSLWDNDVPRHENEAQRLFFVMSKNYCKALNIDITPEANAGCGPVDFKLSFGYSYKYVIEVKLSTNKKLVKGYTEQLEVYKKSEGTQYGCILIIDVGDIGNKMDEIIKIRDEYLNAYGIASDIFYINGLIQKSASRR